MFRCPASAASSLPKLIRERERTQHTPIIFISAESIDEQFIFKGYSLGAVDYLTKPVEPEILKSKVRFFSKLFLQQDQIRQTGVRSAEANTRFDELNIVLEERVRLRTVELEKTNRELEAELPSVADPKLDSPPNMRSLERWRWQRSRISDHRSILKVFVRKYGCCSCDTAGRLQKTTIRSAVARYEVSAKGATHFRLSSRKPKDEPRSMAGVCRARFGQKRPRCGCRVRSDGENFPRVRDRLRRPDFSRRRRFSDQDRRRGLGRDRVLCDAIKRNRCNACSKCSRSSAVRSASSSSDKRDRGGARESALTRKGSARRGGKRQPHEGRVSRDALTRASNAAQLYPRLVTDST